MKGKILPGRMGGQKNTIHNLEVLYVNQEKECIIISGSIAGPKKSIAMIYSAKKPKKGKSKKFNKEDIIINQNI